LNVETEEQKQKKDDSPGRPGVSTSDVPFQEGAMPSHVRRLMLIVLLVLASVAFSAFASSQVSVAPTPVTPVVLSGADLGFRMTGHKRGTPVGQLVVRVNGEWREVEFEYGVKQLTKR
jgi:hypothetical protein